VKNIEYFQKSSRVFLLFLFYAVIITLPFSTKINGFFLIGFMAASMLHVTQVSWTKLSPRAYLYIISSALFFFIHVSGLLYTDNIKAGIFALDKKWSIAVIPIGVLIATQINLQRRVVLLCFFYSVFAASIFALGMGFVNNYNYNLKHELPIFSFNHWYYSYKLLSANVEMHPAYLSCYISLVLFFVLLQITTRGTKKRMIVTILLCSYLLFYLVLLSSRNVLVTTLILTFFMGSVYVYYSGRIKLIIIGVSVYVAIFLAIISNEITRSRIVSIFDIGNTDSQWGNISLRLQEWDASSKLFKDNPLIGVGPGDFTDEIVKQYEAHGWTDMAKQKYNSHNQFIETAASLGLIGLVILLAIFGVSFVEAVIRRDLLYIIFLSSFIMFSLTESTLEVQKGIVFFTVFNSVFFFTGNHKLEQDLANPKQPVSNLFPVKF
jgi:O-antigen ligase